MRFSFLNSHSGGSIVDRMEEGEAEVRKTREAVIYVKGEEGSKEQ